MRTADDARRDPVVGDVFQKGRTWRKVIGFRNEYCRPTKIVSVSRNGSRLWSSNYSFVKWARYADVIRIAQAEGER